MHYKNGREAKVGDLVIGKTYNTQDRTITGTIVSITPGIDACSALVSYVELKLISELTKLEYISPQDTIKIQGTQNHGSAGELAVLIHRFDYTHCGNLLHADDVFLSTPEVK